MVELYSKKKIVTDHMFDVNFRGKIVGINTFSVTFMSHGADTIQCTILVLDPTNPDINRVKTVTVLLSYADAKVAQKDMEAFINAVWNNNVTVFDPKPEDIKYVPGKRPMEDISLIKTSAYYVVELKDVSTTYVYPINDMDLKGEYSPFGFNRPFSLSRTSSLYRSAFDNPDSLPIYQEENIIQEIFDNAEIIMSPVSINDVINYASNYPKEYVHAFYIVDGKISKTGKIEVGNMELEIINDTDDEEKK